MDGSTGIKGVLCYRRFSLIDIVLRDFGHVVFCARLLRPQLDVSRLNSNVGTTALPSIFGSQFINATDKKVFLFFPDERAIRRRLQFFTGHDNNF